QGANPLHGVGL
ncbi:hypothetical protein MG5_02840, partial [Candida albicans P57072]